MIVIADTTPLNYLILIHQSDILQKLYGRVIIPEAVREELEHERTPVLVRSWIASPPVWLEVRQVKQLFDPALEELDEGERQAICLAEELGADALVLDDKHARKEALRRRFTVVGTLGVLDEAAKLGFVNLPTVLAGLRKTSFRADEDLLAWFLVRDAERRKPR